MRALSRREPDRRRILEGHPGSTDGSIGPVPKLGSLDRTSFNSIWRRVSIQVSVAASEVPRSSASVTHQERCSVSACHTAHDHAVPMPQSAGNDAKDLAPVAG